MPPRLSTINQRNIRSDTIITLTQRVSKRIDINRSRLKFFYIRQEVGDMPPATDSFPPTKFLFRRFKIIGVHSHAKAGTWNANLTIAGLVVGDVFTDSNSGDAEEPLQFSSEIIYEDAALITIKMNSADLTVEEWETIIIMLALDQA